MIKEMWLILFTWCISHHYLNRAKWIANAHMKLSYKMSMTISRILNMKYIWHKFGWEVRINFKDGEQLPATQHRRLYVYIFLEREIKIVIGNDISNEWDMSTYGYCFDCYPGILSYLSGRGSSTGVCNWMASLQMRCRDLERIGCQFSSLNDTPQEWHAKFSVVNRSRECVIFGLSQSLLAIGKFHA